MHTGSSPLVIYIFYFFVLNRFWNNHKASLTLENQQAQAYSLYFSPQNKMNACTLPLGVKRAQIRCALSN